MSRLKKDYNAKRPIFVAIAVILILSTIGGLIFYLRYPYAYDNSNFFAEDGAVLLKNIFNKGPLVAPLSLFNGYLIVGQYLLAELAVVISYVFGHGFLTLPKAIAVVSYLFLGFICTLPYLLFRKKMGVVLSLLAFCLLAIVPFGGWDYTTIGTIANLKFAFFFVAALLVLYRNQIDIVKRKWQFILIDFALLLCVTTNILSITLIPFVLWRYRKELRLVFSQWRKVITSLTLQHFSAMALLMLCVLYVLAIHIKGTSSMQGYLDQPIQAGALVDILYRGSIYGLLFPINSLMNDYVAYGLIALVIILSIFSKRRAALMFLGLAVFINVFGFVANRPGVTALFQNYNSDGGPANFFYAGTMIFVFAVTYSLSDWFKYQTSYAKIVIASLVIVGAIIVIPAAGSRNASYNAITHQRPTLNSEVTRVCAARRTNVNVELDIYPTQGWSLTLPREEVCPR